MSTVDNILDSCLDVGNLLLINKDQIDKKIDDKQLNILTQKSTQYLFDKIWSLPRKVVQDATCVMLPSTEYSLPREKPIPKPKEPTKWEKFAKEKGIISKNKRSKKVWDDTTKEWKPRFGYRRALKEENETKDWLIEIPDKADPYKDYFVERSNIKKEMANKQEFQRLKNISRNEKNSQQISSKPLLNSKKLKINGNLEPLGLGSFEGKSKEQLNHHLNRAKKSTSSAGKFQSTLKGEKTPKMVIKRKFESNEDFSNERNRQLEILNKIKQKPKEKENILGGINKKIKKTEEEFKNKEKKGGKRSKSSIDRQQHFEKKKKNFKGNFKSKYSKAGKAAQRKGGQRKN
ncbi:hypothetical protein ACQ4LE_002488 [Meloidogyne hapla]|uniref:Ribosome biogenesis regulatory protein n=1 Tax=Meloidogyne hapla TaxID=6305 RepID=A0A1I8B913_MELHA